MTENLARNHSTGDGAQEGADQPWLTHYPAGIA
ncbi:hypothetical protein M2351_001198 [Azospirillum canadense]|nr:hypothetical protein [Azospirillum canadense]